MTHSNWISIQDRLPQEIIEFVLVARNRDVRTAMEANYMDGEFVTWRLGFKMVFVKPTHWMPLPEPPE